MKMLVNDNTSVAAGRRSPTNQELVNLVQSKGEVKVLAEGLVLTLVRKDKAPFQAFPKNPEDYKLLEGLFKTSKGAELDVQVQE